VVIEEGRGDRDHRGPPGRSRHPVDDIGRQSDHRGQVVAHRLVVLAVGEQRAQRGQMLSEASAGEERRLVEDRSGDADASGGGREGDVRP
jgi:hypothetical protein